MSISIRLGDSLSIHDKVKLTKIGQAAIFCSATDKLFNTRFTGVKAQTLKNSGLEEAVSQSGFVTAINRNGGSHWLLAILNGNSEVAAICPIDKGAGCYGHPAIVFFREKALEICAWVNQEKEVRSEKAKAKKERVIPPEETQPEVVPVSVETQPEVVPVDQVSQVLAMLKSMTPEQRNQVAAELAAMQLDQGEDLADLAIAN